MSVVEKGVVIPLGSSGDFDDAAVNFPSPIARNGQHYIFHEGKLNSANTIRIGLTLSKDSIDVVKKGVVLPQNTGSYNSTHSRTPFVLDINGKLYLLLTGSDGDYRMALAISSDALDIVEKGVVIPLGSSGESDDTQVIQCTVIPLNGRYYIYYSASSDGAVTYQTNLAITSDFVNVTKKGVVVPLGASGAPDDVWRTHPYIEYVNGMFRMYTIAKDGTDKRIMLSISKDGINFTDKGVHEPLGFSGNADGEWVNALVPFPLNGKSYGCKVPVGYTGVKRVGLLISDDRMSSPRPVRPLITDSSCKFFWDGKEVLSRIGLKDESGEGNDGTRTGTAWGTEGLTFDGAADLATIPYDASLNLLDGNFTVVIGHKFNTLPSAKGAKQNFFGEKSGTGTGRNWLTCENTADKFTAAIGGVLYTSTAVATAGWHLVILRFDGSNVDITLDDVTAAGVARTPEAADGDFIIGRHQNNALLWFDGIFDAIILFTKSLSTAEMTEIYAWWRGR